MKLNGMTKIDESRGRYIVLVDYGSEGIAIVEQYEKLDEAVNAALQSKGGSTAIVQLVEVGEL